MRLVTRTGRHGKGKRRMEIGASVTDVRLDRGIVGAPTLEVDVSDPDWGIVQSPMLDLNVDGKLDHVEVRHGGHWYRLVKVTPSNDDLALTFENRVVGILRQYDGAMKKQRTPGYTRAMFIRDLVREANKDGHSIGFRCPSVSDPQEIADANTGTHTKPATGHTGGARGFSKGVTLHYTDSAGGGPKHTVDASQKAILEEGLNIAVSLNAPDKAMWALVEAMIVETAIRNLQHFSRGGADSLGVLAVRVSTSGSATKSKSVKWSCMHFLQGYSSDGKGAIYYARHSSMSSGAIAQSVQRSAYPGRYQLHEDEAKKIVDAFNGGTTGPTTVTVEQAYNFARMKGENSWDCMNRLADEVDWKVFVVGEDVFYMSEEDMYRQKPVHVVHRDSPPITAFGFDWDQGKHISECTFSILKPRWHALPGEAVEVTGAGPADQRWIVAAISTADSSPTADVTLNTVSAPKPEPAPATKTITLPGSGDGAATGNTQFDDLVAACKNVSKNAAGYVYGAQHTTLSKINVHGNFDCSSSVSFVLWKAGLWGLGSVALTSGALAASWGRAGTGNDFTVWANAVHVFIEFNHTIKRFDTSPWEAGPLGPRVRHSHRPHGGFTPRHWPGM